MRLQLSGSICFVYLHTVRLIHPVLFQQTDVGDIMFVFSFHCYMFIHPACPLHSIFTKYN